MYPENFIDIAACVITLIIILSFLIFFLDPNDIKYVNKKFLIYSTRTIMVGLCLSTLGKMQDAFFQSVSMSNLIFDIITTIILIWVTSFLICIRKELNH